MLTEIIRGLTIHVDDKRDNTYFNIVFIGILVSYIILGLLEVWSGINFLCFSRVSRIIV